MAGRPLGRTQDRPLQMRVSEGFVRKIDDWRRTQPDLPSRAEAIRRLVEMGLGRRGRADVMPVLGARPAQGSK